ncbi:DegT/DnrJ/EryC1/StrS family aminotransferase [uncultured Desulfobacter sp.]|uniref:DegT/DnrJ/EryC1/StrS family aminotransferase n=1 Tax=uncultured Desulfobacter sp. TaxID=240139 RepID=UPI0029F46738|nr:DegT/DnrJ/EryC1/StrS family aminotransferase [uncultured Desulfobacter sp.]
MPGFELFSDEERKQVNDVLETGVLFRYGFEGVRNGHFKALEFEKKLAQITGAGFSHLCSSGTAALCTALAACGIGAGDEVIVPPFTFVATFEAVIQAGAIPVFADIDQTLCLDPDRLEAAVTSRTKAVVPVHMCGSMARIDEIKAFCDKKGLVLLEDACQSLGASFQGSHLGTFGKAGCFSFDSVKTVTCGEGGGIITNDEDIYTRCDQYADHGHDHLGGPDRGADDHPIMGTNYRICELNAAVGLAQLGKLDRIVEIQKKNKAAIKNAMQEVEGVTFRELPDPAGDSATFLSFFMPSQDRAEQAAKKLSENGAPCAYWYNNNWHYYKKWHHLKEMKRSARLPFELSTDLPDYAGLVLEQSENIMKRTLSMQIMLSWTADDMEKRIQAVLNALK